MRRFSCDHCVKLLLACLLLTTVSAAYAQTDLPKDLAPGTKIEVREGDTWTAATIVKKEGRRYLIHYEGADASEDEWVATDRLRLLGTTNSTNASNAAPGDAGPAEPASQPAKPAVAKFKWKVGDSVEVKWGGSWRKATIKKRQNEWTLVNYERFSRGEWVEPWRIRDSGSDYDTEYASPNGSVRDNEPPPRPTVGQPPAAAEPGEKRDPFAPLPFDQPVTEAVQEGMKEILPVSEGAWAVPVDSAALKAAPSQPVALTGPGKDSVASLILNPNSAVLVYKSTAAANQENLNIERVNLASASGRGVMPIDRATMPVDLSPSGKLMLARANGFFGGTKHRLDLWQIDQKDLKHSISFIPYPEKSGHQRDITWAQMVDEDHALTCDGGGELVCWQLSKATALWRLGMENNPAMAFSPSRKHLYVCTDDGLFALDPLAGKILGALPNEGRKYDELSVSGDGKTLFGIQGTVLTAFDLEKGVLIDEMGLPLGVQGGSVLALSDQHALVGGSFLFDLKAQSVLWQYSGANRAPMEAMGGRVYYYFGGNNRSVLSNAKLPHEPARQAASKLSGEPWILAPGDTVSVSMELDAPEEERKAIHNAVLSQLEKGGLKVADGAPVRLVLRTEDGKTEQQTYRRIGGGFGPDNTETVNVTTKITRIFYEKDGKVLWERRTESRAGFMLHMKEDQSISQAVQESNKFNIAFLKQVRVPSKVCATRDPLVQGKSALVLAGPKDE